jgi:PAS domain S-box-containing protein
MEKAKILIVEDEAIIAMEIENQLQSLGYEVTSIVDTGVKAIKKAEEDRPDLILMDIRIKGEMDGIDTAEEIRNRFGIPVIFSTAYLDEERIERTKITMPFGYVLKPIQERDLKVTLEMALYTSRVDTERRKTEEKLKKSEKQRRAWLENSPDCTKIVDLDFNLQYMSGAGVRGLRIDDISPYYGKPYPFDFYPDSFKIPMRKNLAKAKETGETITQEAPVVDVEGNEVWFHSTIVPVNDDEGQLDYLMVVSIDTTNRKQVEETLKESEEKYRLITENSADAIFITNQKGNYVYVNKRACEMLNYSKEELLNMNINDVSDPDQLDDINKEFQILLKSGKLESDLRLKKKDNSFVQASLSAIVLPNGTLFGSCRDITDRKIAEEELKKTEHRLSTHIELTPMGVIEFDNEFEIISWNPGAERTFGFTKEEVIGENAIDLLVPNYDREEVKKIYLLQDSKPGENINDNKKKDGEIITCHWFNTPMFDLSGNVIGMTSVCQDITNQLKTEQALKDNEIKYRKLFQDSIDGYALADPDTGIIIDCNQALADIVGRSIEEMIGQHQRILHPQSEHEEDFSSTFKKHMSDNSGENLSTQLITKTREIKNVSIRARVFEVNKKKIMHGIFRLLDD